MKVRPLRFPVLAGVLAMCCYGIARSDGNGDNQTDNVRPVPPPGITVLAEDKAALTEGLAKLGSEIDALSARSEPIIKDLLPDVIIYHNAVKYALDYGEFFNAREIPTAKELLAAGMERAESLKNGKAPWSTATGLVVRGYRSKIDGSVQPYGLVIPESYSSLSPTPYRLDFWFHGRGEVLSEVNFIQDRRRNRGEFTPPNTLVLHPYGRYCNANKLAGEVDTLEALEHAKRHYSIDANRISVRGFSMGGAACWQFAVHFPGEWAAAAPGAGFSETPDFLKVFQKETLQPTWYEKKLWHMYDCVDYAINLFNLPTVAYSGEIDSQKQAADIMAAALSREGIEMVHIIGPKTGHSYHPVAKVEVNRRMDAIMSIGRKAVPKEIRFTTWTLRYPTCRWLTIEGLTEHWEQGRVDADISSSTMVVVKTTGVTALRFDMGPGECPLDVAQQPVIAIDKQKVMAPSPLSDRSWSVRLVKAGERWRLAAPGDSAGLHKRPGLQGPVDDAFLDRFVFVKPTGTPINAESGAWAASEMEHAISHWRKQYRGDVPVVDDSALTDDQIANSNLIIWGDISSNKALAKMASGLPVKWDGGNLVVGDKRYPIASHAPILIFPNPLNPSKYVVLNSGFTFREYDYLNNARQVPKIPDWAVVDFRTKPNSRWPGKIVDAGFFDEAWKWKAAPGR